MLQEVRIADEIAQVSYDHPHVVLLGAGASCAAFPHGDRNGRRLPLMSDFTEIVPLKDVLINFGVDWRGGNFETLYGEVSDEFSRTGLKQALESTVYEYFASLELPNTVTLYDYLISSLRQKDVIATFNWDPFLIQAIRRNRIVGRLPPRICFLHGNVLAGYCPSDKVHGVKGCRCSRCGGLFQPSRLFYPIRENDYHADPAIKSAWDGIRWAFQNAFMVTVFGYSAPVSDCGAIDLLLSAWGGGAKRPLEQFEIIDIRPEDELRKSWQSFIHTHHYQVHRNFFDSWIAKHPRRTGEAFWNQYIEAKFIEENQVPLVSTLDELWQWFGPLMKAERLG